MLVKKQHLVVHFSGERDPNVAPKDRDQTTRRLFNGYPPLEAFRRRDGPRRYS
jgi:hypothetical protein